MNSDRRRVLVTGATGFVGRSLCEHLDGRGYLVRAAFRGDASHVAGVTESVRIGEITSHTDWSDALRDVDYVVHAAARAHVVNDPPSNAELYMETNARGTLQLANAAAAAGVRRLVYLSSIKVNGEQSPGQAFTAHDKPSPNDSYGVSKQLAEQHVMEISGRTGMEAVIVRPPLVYGGGVRANFLRLMRLVDRQRPLPLGAVNNRRSLVSVWNLCDFLGHVLGTSQGSGRIWMISDGEDLSTPDLVRRIARQMGRQPRLLAVPVPALRLFGKLTGRGAEITRLCGSLFVDISPALTDLQWKPPMRVDEAIGRTVRWYLSSESTHDA